ncbi:MAG: hypothetical protein WCC38_14445 [Pseudonocardiaceae bacterium]
MLQATRRNGDLVIVLTANSLALLALLLLDRGPPRVSSGWPPRRVAGQGEVADLDRPGPAEECTEPQGRSSAKRGPCTIGQRLREI